MVVVRRVDDARRPVASDPEEYELPTTLLLLLLESMTGRTAAAASLGATVSRALSIKAGDSDDGGVGG